MLIPRIRLSPNTETLPVPLKRLQFPVRLAFAMTINKSQGQLVEHVGINLQTSVFSHGPDISKIIIQNTKYLYLNLNFNFFCFCWYVFRVLEFL